MANVLVAEDNPLNYELVRDVLVEAGHTVGWAHGGADAIAQLRSGEWPLLLLDLHMPDLDGYGVLAAIRGDPALKDLKVVVLSADAMQGVPAGVLEAGADGYLSKPLDIDALLHEVGPFV